MTRKRTRVGAAILSDNRAMATEKTVRSLALALPEASERPCYGTPGFYVKKKLFARLLPDRKTLAVRVDLGEREALLAAAPEVFFLTPHYEGWPMVLIHLPRIERADLEDRLAEAWRFMAPAKLLAAFDASQ
ncbi:MAG: MmcQ/YjbR family DNA-binding protein [Myxococcota bacterium]